MRITVNLNKVITSTNKSLLKASDLIRTPLRSRLWGVTGRGFKGEADEDPCGRVLGPRPLNEAVMLMTKNNYEIKLRRENLNK